MGTGCFLFEAKVAWFPAVGVAAQEGAVDGLIRAAPYYPEFQAEWRRKELRERRRTDPSEWEPAQVGV